MRTSLRFAISGTAAASTSYVQSSVSGNGCFDPGLSLSSGQPVGFDYWAVMYERYRVIGSRCVLNLGVEGSTTGGSVSAMIGVALFPATQSGALSALDDAASQPHATRVNVTTEKPVTITKTMKTSTVTGIKDMLGADQLQALISAQPANEWFWNMGVSSDQSWISTVLKYTFTITYDVEFFDRGQINRSTLSFIHKAYIVNCIHIEQRLQEQKAESQRAVTQFEIEKKLLAHELALDAKHGDGVLYSETKGVITGDIDSPVMVSVTEDQVVKKVPLSVKLPQPGAAQSAGKASAPPSSRGLGGRILSLGSG
jgi:hypothetical protein